MVEVCTQVNVILLNTNFSCYNVIDKSASIISKDIETGVINDVFPCIRCKLNLLSHHKVSGRKVKTIQLSKNHEKSVLWKTVRS